MTPKTGQTVKMLADHFYLEIKYAPDLPDNVSGFLQSGPDPCYIIINARKSPSDQVLTILHELGHYVLHVNSKPVNFLPSYLNFAWNAKPLNNVARTSERWMRRKCDQEWQADLWAFIILWRIQAVDDLLAITELYPEKNRMFWISLVATFYGFVKRFAGRIVFWR